MNHFSMFSGVEGFGLGLGEDWQPIGFSEIDKYASQVLKYHYPNVKNYGDCTKIDYGEVPDFDLLTGGSPCQDFSIAGKRKGLKGSRSSLAWEFIRCLRSKKPRYFIWENVKGVMSSRSGWDFANILTAFSESGYDLWWQVLNAKDFGVPQNRERIFVVGFRERSPKEVFFEPKDSGQIEIVGTTRPESNIQDRARILSMGGVSQALRSTDYKDAPKIMAYNEPRYNEFSRSCFVQNLTAVGKASEPKIIIAPNKKEIDLSEVPNRPFQVKEVRTEKGKMTRKEIRKKEGRDSTKRGRDDKKYIPNDVDSSNCLTTNGEQIENWIFNKGQIRRLTPLECERLMGWPDNWTRWGNSEANDKGEISDSQRYKMCGNGVVSSCVREIAKHLL